MLKRLLGVSASLRVASASRARASSSRRAVQNNSRSCTHLLAASLFGVHHANERVRFTIYIITLHAHPSFRSSFFQSSVTVHPIVPVCPLRPFRRHFPPRPYYLMPPTSARLLVTPPTCLPRLLPPGPFPLQSVHEATN